MRTVSPLALAAIACLALALAASARPTLSTATGPRPPAATRATAWTPPTNVTGSWASLTPPPNGGSLSRAVTATDGKVYGIGSFTTNGSYQPQMASYSPATNAWALLAALPTISPGYTWTGYAMAAGTDRKIYLLGGEGYSPTSIAYAYDPTSNSYAAIAPLPTARTGLAATTGTDGRIYAIGGTGVNTLVYADELNVVEVYTPSTNTWTTAAPLPNGLAGLAATSGADGRIYTLGGVAHGTDLEDVNWVYAHAPSTNAWSVESPLPVPTNVSGTGFGTDGRLYAVGQTLGYQAAAQVFVYSPTQDLWGFGPALPSAEYVSAASLLSDGRVFTVGSTIVTPPATGSVVVEALTVLGQSESRVYGHSEKSSWGSSRQGCELTVLSC